MGLPGQSGLEAGVDRGKGWGGRMYVPSQGNSSCQDTEAEKEGVMSETLKESRVAGLQSLRESAGG